MDGHGNPEPNPATATLRDMVVERIRSSIVSGRTAPGTLFSVPTLADEIGISTTPVREGLLELARAGLVSPVRNRGFRVESTSLESLQHLFTVRELLECAAITTLARQRPTDPATLRRLAQDVEAAAASADVSAYITTDRAFHAELAAQAGNPLLTRLIMEARDAMRLYGIDTEAGKQRQRASVTEHVRLIDLAEAGAAKDAAKLMRSHILDWQPVFTEALRRRGDTML